MNNKSEVLTNVYDCTRYFTGFTFLENEVLLVFASHLSFEFIKLNIKASFGFC